MTGMRWQTPARQDRVRQVQSANGCHAMLARRSRRARPRCRPRAEECGATVRQRTNRLAPVSLSALCAYRCKPFLATDDESADGEGMSPRQSII